MPTWLLDYHEQYTVSKNINYSSHAIDMKLEMTKVKRDKVHYLTDEKNILPYWVIG